ncbi:hypothetical protein F5Y15DRAFT_283725 [Xylariaceae sp. FL0016]|nr:hypothetical protein F5Y15DRAFT_283725 [Xylariaceae sp. FL0016]
MPSNKKIQLQLTYMLLVHVLVGKLVSTTRLQSILRQIPMRPEVPGWNYVNWVQEALEVPTGDKTTMGTSMKSWMLAHDAAMWYVERKKAAHRFDGQAKPGQSAKKKAANWDMLEGELVP